MKRQQTMNKRSDAILTSDWHLREDQPTCRTDDFWEAQWDKVRQISDLQRKHDCPVMHAGDLFHHWKPSPYLLSETIGNLPDQFFSVMGQHDLPQHNLNLFYKSGINVLSQAHALKILRGSWGEEIQDSYPYYTDFRIAIWHKFVWDGEKIPWPGCEEATAKEVLRDHPDYDLIVTGDHHKPFVEYYVRKDRHRVLVNPGCLTRQAADYADHRPRVYLWYAEDNTVEPHYLSVADGVVSREHIERQAQRNERIEAFVSRLNTDWEVAVSFEENLERFMTNNRMRVSVKEVIYKAVE